jgi:hypothetical protein
MACKNSAIVTLIVISLVIFGMTSLTWACPFCDGGPAGINRVKAGVFNESFFPRAAAVLAPFPIFAGIVALIYFGPPKIGCRK